MKYNLKLQHKDVPSHVEYWTVNDKNVDVVSVTPQNFPQRSIASFTKKEALRNLALMTSKQEGWEIVDNDDVWHKFIDDIEPKCIVQVAWNREASDIMEMEGFDTLSQEAEVNHNLDFDEKEFNTRDEAIAYMDGISDGNGWDSPNYKIKGEE